MGLTGAERGWNSRFLPQVMKMLLSPTYAAQIVFHRRAGQAEEKYLWEGGMQRETLITSDVLFVLSFDPLIVCLTSIPALAFIATHTTGPLSLTFWDGCVLYTVYDEGESVTDFPPASSGKYVFSFPMCTWSSSLQRFPVQSGLKDSPVQLDVCSQKQSVRDEQLVRSAKGEPEMSLLLWALCLLKGQVRSLGFVQQYRKRGSWTLIFY